MHGGGDGRIAGAAWVACRRKPYEGNYRLAFDSSEGIRFSGMRNGKVYDCPLWNRAAQTIELEVQKARQVECPNCTIYEITFSLEGRLSNDSVAKPVLQISPMPPGARRMGPAPIFWNSA